MTSRPNGEVPGAARDADGRRSRVVQAASLALPLAVRNRRPGDRFRPLGAPGRRKLQDVFVDRKVPRNERDRVPVVVDANGRIVWVAGVTIADECRVTAPEAGVVILELKRKTQMNSTLKSLLFWMVLVVIGASIWQFSTTSSAATNEIAFTEFLGQGQKRPGRRGHVHGQRDHRQVQRPAATAKDFHTVHAAAGRLRRAGQPARVEGRGHQGATPRIDQPVDDAPRLRGRRSC